MSTITVNKWNRVVEMEPEEIVRFQLTLHAIFTGIHITRGELDVLVYIVMNNNALLKELCKEMVSTEKFASQQSIRNTIDSLEQKGLIVKTGSYKKIVTLAPSVVIQTTTPILVDVKALAR